MNERLAALVEAARDRALDPGEDAELAGLLADPVARAEAVAQWRAGLLAAALAGPPAEAIARAVRGAGAAPVRHPGRRRLLAWGAAACLAAIVGLLAWPAAPPRLAVIAAASGAVRIEREGAAIAARTGMPLRLGDRIVVAGEGEAAVAYADRSSLTLGAGAALRFADGHGAKLVELAAGELRCDIAPQPAGLAMRLRTAHAEAVVMGTRFSLQASADRTRLVVSAGRVELRRADGSIAVVEAGMAAEAGTPGGGQVIFRRDFAAAAPAGETDNPRLRLPGPDGQVDALGSLPYRDGTPAWHPDVAIEYHGAWSEGAEAALFSIPEELEIRIRIRAEHPGTCELTLNPAGQRFPDEHFSSTVQAIGPAWREIRWTATDLAPYEAERISRACEPGVPITRFAIYGFGTGAIAIDAIIVSGRGSRDF